MKQIFKFPAKVALTMMVVLLVTAILLWFFLPKEKIRAVLIKELSNRLNQDITMSEFSVGFYPNVEFLARDIRLADPSTSQEILSAKKVRFDLNLRELLSLKCVVEDITFGSPTINFKRDVNGEWNVEKLIKGVLSGEKKADASKQVSWLEFSQIQIDNGTFRIHDEASGQHLSIQKIAANFDVRKETLHIDLASLSLPSLEADLSGTVSQFSKPSPVLGINATLQIRKEGPFSDIPSSDLPGGATIADISLDASGQFTKIALNTTFSFNPLATAEITTRGSIVGTLQIEEGIFEIDTLKTYFGESTLSLSGTCNNIWQKERTAHLEGKTSIALEETIALVGKELFSSLEFTGAANATITLNTSMEQVGLKTNINLRNAGFTIPHVMHKKGGIPGLLVIDAHYSIPDELAVDNFQLVIDRAKINGKAQVRPESEPWFMTSFHTSGLPLAGLNRLPAVRFDEGMLTLLGEVWQSSPTQESINYSGEATIEHATLLIKALQEPIRDLDGRIEVSNDKVHMHSASFAFGESRYQTQAEVADFSNPKIVGQLYTAALDINKIVDAFAKSKTGTEKSPSSKTATRPDFSLEVLVEADAMCFKDVRTDAFSTVWHTSGRVQEFSPFHIDAFGGELKGTLDLAFLENGANWAVDFNGQEMDIEVIEHQLLEKTLEGKAKGLLSVEGSLGGKVSRKKGEVWSSLDGILTLTATEGEIRQSPLFNSMMLAIQLPVSSLIVPGLREATLAGKFFDVVKTRGRTLNVKRMIFKGIDGTFQLAGGVAHTEDLFFNGETVDLLFKGDLDFAEEQIDMKIKATTPTGSIGSLLGKVPVAGKGWEKAKKSILSLSFIARGPISNPQVHLSAVDRLKPKKKKKQSNAP